MFQNCLKMSIKRIHFNVKIIHINIYLIEFQKLKKNQNEKMFKMLTA